MVHLLDSGVWGEGRVGPSSPWRRRDRRGCLAQSVPEAGGTDCRLGYSHSCQRKQDLARSQELYGADPGRPGMRTTWVLQVPEAPSSEGSLADTTYQTNPSPCRQVPWRPGSAAPCPRGPVNCRGWNPGLRPLQGQDGPRPEGL